MSDQTEDTEKTFDPTPQKLLEARKKGEVAKSNDLLAAAAYAGLMIALLISGEAGIRKAGTSMMVLLDQPDQLSQLFFGGSYSPFLAGVAMPIISGMIPFFLLPAIAVLLAAAAQRAIVFAPSKLEPKLSRLSVINNAKNKFGRDGLFEFVKSFIKLLLYSLVVGFFINAHLKEMIAVLSGGPHQVLGLLTNLCLSFLFIVVLIASGIGVIDAIWQHFSHIRKNMMSHKEIMDETKNAEGDPHLKQERRQRAMSISQKQMMGDVPKADVVIVNPTHYAVALKWSRKSGEAPICVAKGTDEIALAIRKAADEASVPIHSDPPTARSLFATTEIGTEIASNFYQAVAAAIRFAEAMRKTAKGRV